MIEVGTTEQVVVNSGAVGFVLLIIHRIWRIFRKERVDEHKDIAELHIIATLQKQNDLFSARAEKAVQERNDAMEELGALRNEVKNLREEVARMRQLLLTNGFKHGPDTV